MKLAEILHLCLISRRTGCIEYSTTEGVGKLWLQDGQLHHAEHLDLVGDDAVFVMLEAESGDSMFIDSPAIPKRTITSGCEHLLMESARRSDERFKTRKIEIPLPSAPAPSNALAGSAPKLLQFNSFGEVIQHTLKLSKTTVGRASHHDLCLNVESLSSTHCEFIVQGQRVFLSDLQSLNGTFINGQRVMTPTPLHEGDTIHIGGIALRFFWMTQPSEHA